LGDLVARGEHGAFDVLFDRHHGGVLALSRQLLGSTEEAEDATQQAFLSAYKALAGHRRPDHLKAWLYTIARNRCLSMLRARREQPSELEHVAVAGFTEHVEQRAELRSLLSDLAELPEHQRSALVLAEIGDFPHAEIAQVLSVEPKQVKALVFQARSGLSNRRFARDTPCEQFREQIAVSTGGSLLRGPLRRHLGACPHCAGFREEVREQRSLLSLALPVVASLTLKDNVMAATGGGAAGSGAAAGTGAAAGGGAGGTATGAGAGATGAAGGDLAAKGALATGAAGGAGAGAPLTGPGLAGLLGSGATGGKIAAAAALLSKVGVAQAATVALVAGGAVVGGGVAIRAAAGGDEADQRSADKAPGAGQTLGSSSPRPEARSRADERRKQRAEARSSRSRDDPRAPGEGSDPERSKATREALGARSNGSDTASPGNGGSGGSTSPGGSSSTDSGPRPSGEERAGPNNTSSTPERSSDGGSPSARPPEASSTPETPKVEMPSAPKAPDVPLAPKLP
jgi:RNA polymerase sigma factor (sigma-70 family)